MFRPDPRHADRIITDAAFDGARILGAILFEQTMDREVEGVPTGQYLWQRKDVVPFLKVGKGLASEQHHVQLMKPMDTLDQLLARANEHQMFGTKMRSVIKDADDRGVADTARLRRGDSVTAHRVRTTTTERGYEASCVCSWRTVRRTREQCDEDVDAHQMANASASTCTKSSGIVHRAKIITRQPG